MIYYDLHIHSCLSPCSQDDMTPNNIMNMSMIKGLDVIAVCDHNSNKQLKALALVNSSVKLLYGIEVQSVEEVHLLAIFRNFKDNDEFYKRIDTFRIVMKNDINYFGHQYVMDEHDNIVEEYENLLLMSINLTLNELIKLIHDYHGIAVCAHVLGRENSIVNQLGFIPNNLAFDAYEVKSLAQKEEVIGQFPFLKDKIFLINSDAHSLIDINEAVNSIDEDTFDKLWR